MLQVEEPEDKTNTKMAPMEIIIMLNATLQENITITPPPTTMKSLQMMMKPPTRKKCQKTLQKSKLL